MRHIILDTETTGLEWQLGHRVIEIGCVELISRRATGRTFHRYLNPERDIDAKAQEVHGLSRERLAKEPRFADVAADLLDFIRDSQLVIHNAAFDIGFLDAEFARMHAENPPRLGSLCSVLDTWSLAREMHPGQRNSLDALCKRYGIDNSHRDLHGALLDARILADVYLAMTGGQDKLTFDERARSGGDALADGIARAVRPAEGLRVSEPTAQELAAHEQLRAVIAKACGGASLWQRLEAGEAAGST